MLTVKLVAAVPLKVTELAPVRLLPLIVTLVPTGPAGRVNELIDGDGVDDVPQPGSLNDPIRVRQLKLPLLGRYSLVYQNVQSSAGSIDMLE